MEIPSILMLNCLGSYFYSIQNYICNEKHKNRLLYYLSLGKLIFSPLNMEDVLNTNGDNPWGYQPVIIQNQEENELKVNHAFLSYLSEKHNIRVEIIDLNTITNLVEIVAGSHAKNCFFITSVDEYYAPTSEKFYKKSHNKHFLLFKGVDHLHEQFEMIDSEKNKTIHISFTELDEMIYKSSYNQKTCYYIDCASYQDNIDHKQMLSNFLALNASCEYIPQLIHDVRSKECMENFSYYYQGYYYTVLSKILPYAHMKHHMLNENNIEFSDKANELVYKWQDLCRFMLFKIRKKSFSADSLVKKISDITSYETNLQLLLDGIR